MSRKQNIEDSGSQDRGGETSSMRSGFQRLWTTCSHGNNGNITRSVAKILEDVEQPRYTQTQTRAQTHTQRRGVDSAGRRPLVLVPELGVQRGHRFDQRTHLRPDGQKDETEQ